MKKNILNIAIPATLLTGLVIFWLVPAMSSTPQTYQRVYENTNAPQSVVVATIDSVKSPKKVSFNEEKLPTLKKLEDIEPEMFSRAVHYHPAEEMDSIMEVYEVVEKTEVVLERDSTAEVVVMKEVVVEQKE